jgi:hypothetical protein
VGAVPAVRKVAVEGEGKRGGVVERNPQVLTVYRRSSLHLYPAITMHEGTVGQAQLLGKAHPPQEIYGRRSKGREKKIPTSYEKFPSLHQGPVRGSLVHLLCPAGQS